MLMTDTHHKNGVMIPFVLLPNPPAPRLFPPSTSVRRALCPLSQPHSFVCSPHGAAPSIPPKCTKYSTPSDPIRDTKVVVQRLAHRGRPLLTPRCYGIWLPDLNNTDPRGDGGELPNGPQMKRVLRDPAWWKGGRWWVYTRIVHLPPCIDGRQRRAYVRCRFSAFAPTAQRTTSHSILRHARSKTRTRHSSNQGDTPSPSQHLNCDRLAGPTLIGCPAARARDILPRGSSHIRLHTGPRRRIAVQPSFHTRPDLRARNPLMHITIRSIFGR